MGNKINKFVKLKFIKQLLITYIFVDEQAEVDSEGNNVICELFL